MIADIRRFFSILTVIGATSLLVTAPASLEGQSIGDEAVKAPRVELQLAPPVDLTGVVDSNSPAIWDRVNGRQTLFVMTSVDGLPSTSAGSELRQLGKATPVVLEPWPGGGVWMEAIVADTDGTWYGYYHNEIPASACGTETKVIPRIGAARSEDHGHTWHSLGIILEAPPRTYDCATSNQYFVGGVGDFSVQLDSESQDLYFFYSTYLRTERLQGIAEARLAWADRDQPAGKITLWRNGVWLPANIINLMDGRQRWVYPAALPIFPAGDSWHDNDNVVDAYWGPSVHWNTYLRQYVMVMSRAQDDWFVAEGIYVSFADTLDDPSRWSTPVRIFKGGKWYPEFIGTEPGAGTDKVAGEWARFFMLGSSRYLAHFIK